MASDKAVLRAWDLSIEGFTDSVMDELETLLPALAQAGYVEITGDSWRWTPQGVERAKLLGSER
ncbi:MAG: hypothetical protein ACRDKU_03655 [Gaiellaceae bacterium]